MPSNEKMIEQLAKLSKENLTTVLRGIEKTYSTRKKTQVDSGGLPPLNQVLRQLAKPGTAIEYPRERQVIFDNPTSAVKKLRVRVISSTDTNMSILHKIHLEIRGKP